MATESLGHLTASLTIPFVVFYFVDLFKYKKKGIIRNSAFAAFAASFLAFSFGLMMIPIVQEDLGSNNSVIEQKVQQDAANKKAIQVTESKKNTNKSHVKVVDAVKPIEASAISYNKVTIVRHVDGDTVVVKFSTGKEEKVRLIGMNTPETVKPNSPVETYGKEASEYTKKRLLGKTVYIESDVGDHDKYGRLLRYVWLNVPEKVNEQEIREKMFNAILLLDGYAQQMTVPPDVKYAGYFRKFEREARENNKGLWGLDKNQIEKDSVTKSVYIQSVDLRKEEVVIKNTSNKNINMSGWKLRSERGNQTFLFPKGFIVKANATVRILSGKGAEGDGVKTLKWTSSYMWNNQGDPAKLFDCNAKLISSK
jgi:micrococcal nuclease